METCEEIIMTANCLRCRKRDSSCSSLDQMKQQATPYDCRDFDDREHPRGGVLGERNWT